MEKILLSWASWAGERFCWAEMSLAELQICFAERGELQLSSAFSEGYTAQLNSTHLFSKLADSKTHYILLTKHFFGILYGFYEKETILCFEKYNF